MSRRRFRMIRRLAVLLTIVAVSVSGRARADSEAYYRRALVSPGDAGRLRVKLRQAELGAPLRVAAIGGSITAGAAASSQGKCYLELVRSWLAARYPRSQVTAFNAGIGGTSSFIGVHRARRNVLDRKPDLVLVEFAVNDNYVPEDEVAEWYEGLVRQSLNGSSHPAVILLFTLTSSGLSMQDVHRRVGAHYNLAMLSYRDAIWPDIQVGRPWSDFSPDSVHPNDYGHSILADLICRYLDETMSAGPVRPITPNRYEHAWVMAGEDDGWSGWEGGFLSSDPLWLGRAWITFNAGPQLTARFRGREATLFYVIGSAFGGTILANVDDRAPVTANVYSEFSSGQLIPLTIAQDLPPGEHTLYLQALPDPRGRPVWIAIAGLGFADYGARPVSPDPSSRALRHGSQPLTATRP